MTETPHKLSREDGETIAYHRLDGKQPTVIFLGGFRSDMTGTKATALEALCRSRGQAFIRFDYFGHGASSGDFADGTISRWKGDALAVIDELSEGPVVLVGSSMGGWVTLLAARERATRLAGLVLIAPAPDFTEDLIWEPMAAELRERLLHDGRIERPSDYDDEPDVITLALIEDGRHNLVMRDALRLPCPIRLLHGMQDDDVPWRLSEHIMEHVEAPDTVMTIVKNGDHRLSEPADIRRLEAAVAELCGD
jgi:pimeloyl-ACP methyl ester carboxylesterase